MLLYTMTLYYCVTEPPAQSSRPLFTNHLNFTTIFLLCFMYNYLPVILRVCLHLRKSESDIASKLVHKESNLLFTFIRLKIKNLLSRSFSVKEP